MSNDRRNSSSSDSAGLTFAEVWAEQAWSTMSLEERIRVIRKIQAQAMRWCTEFWTEFGIEGDELVQCINREAGLVELGKEPFKITK